MKPRPRPPVRALAANWINGEIAARLNRDGKEIADCPISAERLVGLIARIADGTLSSKLAKQVFDALWDSELSADAIIERDGLKQVSDVGAIGEDGGRSDRRQSQGGGRIPRRQGEGAQRLGRPGDEGSGQGANPAQVQDILRQKLA